MVAVQTHATYLAASTAFNGSKGDHLKKFMESLVGGFTEQPAQTGQQIGLSALVALGQKLAAAEASDAQIAREAEQQAVFAMFEKHRTAATVA